MSEQRKKFAHSVIIENRERLNMSGVLEVIGFDDETVILGTDCGRLTVKGENLKMGGFSTASTEVDIIGEIRGIVYSDEGELKGGFFRRLMR